VLLWHRRLQSKSALPWKLKISYKKRNNLQYSDHALSCFGIHLYDVCQQTCWKIKIVSLCWLDAMYKKHAYVKVALFFHPSLYSTLVIQYYWVMHTIPLHLLSLLWYNMFRSSYDHDQVHPCNVQASIQYNVMAIVSRVKLSLYCFSYRLKWS
jgi:hypothetical protein